MKAELKVTILLSIINEARNEIRILKDNVNKYASLITVSSFGITSFLLKEIENVAFTKSLYLFAFIDISFIILLWVILYKLKKDLMFSRSSLELHEKQLSTIFGIPRKIKGKEETQYFDFNPYGSFDDLKIIEEDKENFSIRKTEYKKIKPDFKENGVLVIVVVATLIMLIKPFITFIIL